MRRVVLVGRSSALDRIADAAQDESCEITRVEGVLDRIWNSDEIVVLDCPRAVELTRVLVSRVGGVLGVARETSLGDEILEAGADDCFLGTPTRAAARSMLRRAFVRAAALAERQEELR